MNKDLALRNKQEIESLIFTIRGVQVMLDSHLAEMYAVETKNLNKAVKRNSGRFPANFMFRLTEVEYEALRFQFGTSSDGESLRFQFGTLNRGRGEHRKYLPYVFTEQGVAMLSAVLRSDIAINVSIRIMEAFVEMRKILSAHSSLMQRMDRFEITQIEHGQKIEQVFKALESGSVIQKQGIFFDGQVFDAYKFSVDLIRAAKKSIQLVDNYVDDSVLMHLSKRKKGVAATIYTKTISKLLEQDLKKHHAQYPPIKVKILDKAHDRFLIIDAKVYHIGASLKDLGKKWFAFSLLEKDGASILERLEQV